MGWEIKSFQELSAETLYSILRERTQVFVVEQNCPYLEVDGKDLASFHLYHEIDGEITAYARLLPAGISFPEASIGRVLVKAEYRGQGLAVMLMEKALEFIREEQMEPAVQIQAQEYLRDFYGSFGFEAVTETYLEDGIPHIDMMVRFKERP
ncbi:GNAT family N-acetyltransferase [Bacillus sp. FJAT-42376]|uniref:GNAT family N-acetyltransferase n=1 Tax=Bacillus sp. FJAT-42376 TaxID=2014076 RepID=UPI000F4E120C|nr:GNAT family N-acetyltransferase [Bacillus sp. FJAT-42376]AZB42465.1 GNAT family N-acetyltransferase [Bacillus sp. FJAT-42376]